MGGIAPVDRAAIKTATRRLVAAVGGLEAAATVCRLNKTAIAAAYDPHQPERFLPADAVADLETVAADPIVTVVLARIAAHALVPVGFGRGAAAEAVAEVLGGAGDVGREFARAMRDGHLSMEERRAVADRLLEVQAACMQAVAALIGEEERHGA